FQYAVTDKTYYIRDLGDTIFVAPDAEPSGTKLTAKEAAFEDYVADNVTASASIVAYNIPLTGAPENVEIQVNDVTSSGYIYTDGAAVFVYDKDTGEHYEVVEGIATIPSSAVNLVVYRCDGEWNKGSKTDDVASYWNKWELTEKPAECDVVNLGGSDSSVWISSSDMEADTDAKYYLVGFFDGVDYEGRDYEFDASGKLTVHFALDSYVYVISSTNKSYWTNGWLGEDLYSATLYKATSLAKADKLYVPSGNIEFKLTVNNDGTVTLAYEALPVQLEDGEIEVIDSSYLTTQETVDVSTLENLIDVVYGIVINDYRYASFEAYANIKELYYEYAKIDPAKVTAAQKTELYNKLKAAYDEYEVMTEKNNIVTVYFCNDISWSNVRAHIYNSKTGEELTSFDKAMGISAIKTLDSGVKIYEVTINQSKWDKVVFTNGAGAKTAEITVPTKNHIGYYFTDSDVTADAVVPGMFLYTYDELPDVEYVNVFKGIMPGTVLGTLQTKVNADENLPKMEIKNLTMDLVKNLLTVQEWAEVKAGANLLIYLNTVNADNNAPQADKDAITKLVENKLEKGKVGMYIDLSLYKQIGDNKATKITNTNGNKITISVDVPEKLKNNDKNINRMFYVVRVHDGKAEFLTDGTTENTLLFETDRFSTYAIVYNDVAVEGNPKTGDITNIALLVLLLSAGCSAMVVANRKRKVNI
ncbi:MAG: LPXTG cell wall anchor domain-containing protein, partial [Lachnospiraceae bacterium]|nr:LPXTG cell wall anchor domain-containing protein [Lachnospiraceae bacterium]